jgi:sugar transferase (PEP-CTERM/EpsH1 system associated)
VANLLYLVHRMPYPPDKGDKVRSYHLLRHLAERHRVFLGTFADDPADLRHLGTLRQWCAGLHVVPMNPRAAKLRSLAGLATGEPLSVRAWRDAGLRRWVRETVAREAIDAGVLYSSAVAQYADELGGRPLIVDFVDVDSAKWSAYAERHAWPLSWLYRREGRTLLAYERAVASASRRSFFSTAQETALFTGLAPEAAPVCEAMTNGVDASHFAPDPALPSPFAAGERAIVFTGAMDYWPNVDAVGWFAREMLPALRRTRPDLHFWIVGRSPAPAVQALAGEHVHVTGTVPDVRPYLQHAAAVVAPLRLARGIQNKVLEAMAMGQAVVAAQGCVQVLQAEAGRDIVPAAEAGDFVRELGALLDDPTRARAVGAAARQRVLRNYAWSAHLSAIDRHLERLDVTEPVVARPALGALA